MHVGVGDAGCVVSGGVSVVSEAIGESSRWSVLGYLKPRLLLIRCSTRNVQSRRYRSSRRYPMIKSHTLLYLP